MIGTFEVLMQGRRHGFEALRTTLGQNKEIVGFSRYTISLIEEGLPCKSMSVRGGCELSFGSDRFYMPKRDTAKMRAVGKCRAYFPYPQADHPGF